jgi:hypothetical protein
VPWRISLKKPAPEHLGPAISVCYWQGGQWNVAHNPAPGEYPLPADPGWLNVPVSDDRAMAILHSNNYRYLWAKHHEELRRLSQRQDPSTWLTEQLSYAQQWGWTDPEQVLFVIRKLTEAEAPVINNWAPQEGEAPQVHYERLFNEAKFWAEKDPYEAHKTPHTLLSAGRLYKRNGLAVSAVHSCKPRVSTSRPSCRKTSR